MLANTLSVLLFLAAPAPQAQPRSEPLIWVATSTFHKNRPGGMSSGGGRAIALNRSETFVTYALRSHCGFSAGPALKAIHPDAPLGWRVTVTPRAVGVDDVKVEVSWIRERSQSVEAKGSTEFLIRKGDNVPLDIAATPEWAGGCGMTSAELSLKYEPMESSKWSPGQGSVISTDMWLIRRLANGQDQTEQINVRGGFNEEIPFYFADQKSDGIAMSVLGTVRARARANGEIALEFSAERQFHLNTSELGRGFTTLFPQPGSLLFKSPQDVISVEFPLTIEPRWKTFGTEQLSIRIKTQRIR